MVDNPQVVVPKPLLTFTMYYRSGNNPHPMIKNFNCLAEIDPRTKRPNIQDAINRARTHCETMGLRFIRCVPFLSNLELEERLHNQIGVSDD